MADCTKYQDLISAKIDGTLTAAEQAALEAHLSVCPECRALLDIYARLWSSPAPAVLPPAALQQNVMEAVRQAPIPKSPRPKMAFRCAAAAACAVLVLLAALSPRILDRGRSADLNAAPEMVNGGSDAFSQYTMENNSAPMDGGDCSPWENTSDDIADDAEISSDLDAGTDAAPTPIPSSIAPTARDDSATGTAAKAYRSVIRVSGPLPEVLLGFAQISVGDGIFHIYVDQTTAEALLAQGFTSEPALEENADTGAADILVIYESLRQ